MTEPRFPRVAALKTAQQFRQHLASEQIPLEFDDTLDSGASAPLAQPLEAIGCLRHHDLPSEFARGPLVTGRKEVLVGSNSRLGGRSLAADRRRPSAL